MSAQPPNQYPPQPPSPPYGAPYPPPTQPTQYPQYAPPQPQYPQYASPPHQAPAAPPLPSDKPSFFSRDQKLVMTIASASLAVIILLASAGVLAARFQPQLTPTPFVAVPTATLAPTVAPVPTPTAAPCPLICGAVLGGTQDDFTAAYGQPQVSYDTPCYDFTAEGGWHLSPCLRDLQTGTDGTARVDLMDFSMSGITPPTEADAESLSHDFLPADAKYQRDINDPDVGTLHVYQSGLVARAFPASDFINNGQGGGLVPPGTFAVDCDILVGPNRCVISIGT